VARRSDELLKLDADSPQAVRARFQGAVARYRTAAYADAAAVFEQLVKPTASTPLHHQTAFLLGECRRQMGDLEAAATQYAAAAAEKDGPFAGEAVFRLGFVRFTQGRHDDAIREFEAYLKAHPEGETSDRARLYAGQCRVEKKDYANAEAALRPLTSKPAVAGDATLWLARAFARQNKPAEAAAAIEAHLPSAKDPALLPGLLYDLGRARMEQQKYAEAAQAFGRVATEFGAWEQAPEARHMQALALHRAGDFARSLAACAAFLEKHKAHAAAPEVAFMRAENLLLLERYDEAAAAYGELLKAAPEGAHADECRFRLGLLCHRGQDWEGAVRELLPLAQKKVAGELYAPLPFLLGDAYFSRGEWDPAVEQLEAFANAQPGAANRDVALLKAGLARARKDDAAGAVTRLRELADKHPQSPHRSMGLLELGRLLYEGGKAAEAKQALSGVPADEKDLEIAAQAAYYLGWVALAEKNDAEAQARFGVVADKHGASSVAADAILQLGNVRLRTGDLSGAQAALERLIKDYPKREKADFASFYLGLALARQSQWEKALPHFRSVLETKDSSLRDRAMYESAWCHKRLNRAAEAAKQYTALLAEFPQSDLAHQAAFELAELEFDERKYDDAVKRLSGVLAATQDKALAEQVVYRLGWAQAGRNDPAAAAQAFEKLIAEFPQTRFLAPASFQAGEARMKLQETDKARDHFARAAAQKEPADVREAALLRLGETQALTGRWAESGGSYTTLLNEFPQSAWKRRALLGVGWARENQRQHAPAIEAYNQVLASGEADETAARAQFQVGECLFAMQQYEQAIQALIKVSVSYAYPAWSSRALLEVGRALEMLKKTDEARAQYEEVARDYADSDAAAVAREKLQALSASKP